MHLNNRQKCLLSKSLAILSGKPKAAFAIESLLLFSQTQSPVATLLLAL